MDTDMNTFAPKYGVNKRMCAETKYADNFFTFQARSPFAQVRSEQPVAAAAGKK